MNHRGLWFVGAITLVLGGCILGYPLDQYNTENSSSDTASSSASSSSGNGGMGGASSSSTGGGGMGGSGANPACTNQIVCNERPKDNCDADCPVHIDSIRASVVGNQYVRALAVDSVGNVAIGGRYADVEFQVDPKKLPTKLPDAGGSLFNEGFVGFYNPMLDIYWAKSIGTPLAGASIGRAVSGLAFDSMDDLLITGTETLAGGTPQVFIQKAQLDEPTTPAEPWPMLKPFSGYVSDSTPAAIATDGTDFYILGLTTDSSTNVPCGMGSVAVTRGMFVAKFDLGGKCQWIRSFDNATDSISDGTMFPAAIYATNAATQGVWITGKTNRSSSLAPLAQDLVGGTFYGFVIALNRDTGAPTFGVKLKGDITPKALAVVTTGAGTARVAVAGALSGTTDLSENGAPKSSFVSLLDIINKPSPNSESPSSYNPTTALFTTGLGNTEATALLVRGDKIHVAGRVSNQLVVPPQGPDLVVPGWSPYIATLSTMFGSNGAPPSLGVQLFESSAGANQSPTEVFMVNQAGNLFLAGSWRTDLNVSTRHDPVAGLLGAAAGSDTSPDIFLAKYSITP